MLYELVYREIGYDDDYIEVFMRSESKDKISDVAAQYKIPIRDDWDKQSCGFYIREISTIALQKHELEWRLNMCQKERERLEKQRAEGPIFDFSGLMDIFNSSGNSNK